MDQVAPQKPRAKPITASRPKPVIVNLDAFRGYCSAAGRRPVVLAVWDVHELGWRISMLQYHLEAKNGNERLFKSSDALIGLIEKEIACHCDSVKIEFTIPCNMLKGKRAEKKRKDMQTTEEEQTIPETNQNEDSSQACKNNSSKQNTA